MKIRIFYLKKNKKYNYTPRYYEGKNLGNPYEFDSRIRKDRETQTNHFTVEWQDIRKESRNRKNREINKTFLVVLAILIFLALYLLDFDLSIFKK
ncbi:hypothetical protein [Capnocytophaga cynodegmi]|uniref:Riboflavin synthase subunit beta n=1 Tax=Capnocytophaga cynodegmi TaxID=28189 RepID=A0A0B7HN18_9FLAO|nr:hypothetical protein [Capnocytophaga cynodegmi]CEN32763.1 conserved hypothetical protein [Capnocytophaga cynodegmi]CEN34753.1 conserved hypothetical protein [Capnocytophaga cynodegmi]CEN38893.1 conserved hypothetical protein [Capnocytophaga cynodegmi]GIM52413.1 hypothetical protein CAPN004_14430 [Capnocytophaga cynodegmi]GIM53559.1 hypothetical protein CAPN005_02060 [Capnocytophaga cynodegmi]